MRERPSDRRPRFPVRLIFPLARACSTHVPHVPSARPSAWRMSWPPSPGWALTYSTSRGHPACNVGDAPPTSGHGGHALRIDVGTLASLLLRGPLERRGQELLDDRLANANVRELEGVVRERVLGLHQSPHRSRCSSPRAPPETRTGASPKGLDCRATEEEVVAWYTAAVIERAKGNQSEATRILHIDRGTLRRRLAKLGGAGGTDDA